MVALGGAEGVADGGVGSVVPLCMPPLGPRPGVIPGGFGNGNINISSMLRNNQTFAGSGSLGLPLARDRRFQDSEDFAMIGNDHIDKKRKVEPRTDGGNVHTV